MIKIFQRHFTQNVSNPLLNQIYFLKFSEIQEIYLK